MKIKIIDLDGCIADDRWRRQLISAAPAEGRASPGWVNRFHAYHLAAERDSPTNLHEVHEWDGELVICTGRPVAYAEMTRRWLTRMGIRPLHVLHRNNHDHRPSHVVKRAQVGWLLAPQLGYDVRRSDLHEAIDDLTEVVKMYQDIFSIPARLVRIGDEEHADG